MPDFIKPLYSDEEIANWFHYYDMTAPLVAVGTITSVDPVSLKPVIYFV